MIQPSEDNAAPADVPDVLTFVFDGNGGAEATAPEDFAGLTSERDKGQFAWQHIRRDAPERPQLMAACGLDSFVTDALIADETRPRCTVHGDGALINLRGINLNPGAEPEDMISVRLWLTRDKVIGISVRPLHALEDLLEAIARGQAPTSPGDFVAKIALRLADRAEPAVATMNEEIDDMEVRVLEPSGEISRPELSALRRRAILLRRFMIPQRDALTTLEIEDVSWLADRDRSRLREAAERVFRLGEELDAIRDRSQIVHDQIMDRRAENMNRQMLLLSIVAAIFLPLGLITGLLGINVGGIPGADSPWAFWAVSGMLLVIGLLLLLWIRRFGFFR